MWADFLWCVGEKAAETTTPRGKFVNVISSIELMAEIAARGGKMKRRVGGVSY